MRRNPELACDSTAFGSGPWPCFSKPISFDARERRVTGVIPHTYAIGSSVHRDGTEGSTMYLIYGLLILAMIFFFVLPITDARTARMKVSVVGSLGVLLAVCAVVPRLIH
jgi:succinate-acetate transporter protein